jgi:hypothetical protein
MLKRSVADRKIAALVKGRDLYLSARNGASPRAARTSG